MLYTRFALVSDNNWAVITEGVHVANVGVRCNGRCAVRTINGHALDLKEIQAVAEFMREADIQAAALPQPRTRCGACLVPCHLPGDPGTEIRKPQE